MKPKTVGRVDGNQTTARTSENAQGLMAGSIILTLDGEMPVEFLNVGDRVISRECGVARITAIRHRTVTGPAVHITAGSLGHTRPDRDVTLPAGQALLFRDWRAQAMFGRNQAHATAAQLADGEFVRLEENVEMMLFEVEFDRPHVIYADGLELLSYCDESELASAA